MVRPFKQNRFLNSLAERLLGPPPQPVPAPPPLPPPPPVVQPQPVPVLPVLPAPDDDDEEEPFPAEQFPPDPVVQPHQANERRIVLNDDYDEEGNQDGSDSEPEGYEGNRIPEDRLRKKLLKDMIRMSNLLLTNRRKLDESGHARYGRACDKHARHLRRIVNSFQSHHDWFLYHTYSTQRRTFTQGKEEALRWGIMIVH